jgi:hypothetical protein
MAPPIGEINLNVICNVLRGKFQNIMTRGKAED